MQMRTRCHSSTTHLDANATLHARIRLDAQCASASCAALQAVATAPGSVAVDSVVMVSREGRVETAGRGALPAGTAGSSVVVVSVVATAVVEMGVGSGAVRGKLRTCSSRPASVVIVMSSRSGCEAAAAAATASCCGSPEEHEERSDDEQPDDESGRRTASVAVWRARPRPARHGAPEACHVEIASIRDEHFDQIGRAFLPIHLSIAIERS